MRGRAGKDGITLRVIAGTHNVLLAMDMAEAKRAGCLGFTIERTDIATGERRWLPNLLRFPDDKDPAGVTTTARAPLQKFRWGDYTVEPGRAYRYRVIARYGSPAQLIRQGTDAERRHDPEAIAGGVTVDLKTEDSRSPQTAVIFNRGAAASDAYVRRFGQNDPGKIPEALSWLSRGLEEALIAFIAEALDKRFALHGAIYEFQKPDLLRALRQAADRGVQVAIVYHARGGDDTATENEAAITAAGITFATPRKAPPDGAIMHNKFLVLSRVTAGGLKPVAVWTGSTNWTEGAIYGQLNVGHTLHDETVAGQYQRYFELLRADSAAAAMKTANAALTAVPRPDANAIPHGITAIFSPQRRLEMLDLYADICRRAKVLMVCAPFLLHEKIRAVLQAPAAGTLRFLLADKEGSFGKAGEMEIMQRDPSTLAAVATILKTPLNDFQGGLLQHAESFHHKGVHIHSKVILADPFGIDPILVTGSANFSTNSTTANDSNSLVIRGDTAVADIYATEFMRMFEHYWFRVKQRQAGAATTLGLKPDESWSAPYFAAGSSPMLDRQAFAGLST